MRIFGFSLMGCLIFSLASTAGIGFPDLPEIKEVNLDVEHVFVPKGFDSNDNSEIIVAGWYPNPCYEWSRAIIQKQPMGVQIRLKAWVKQGMDTVCIDMAVPYMESIKLGPLQEGQSQLLLMAQKPEDNIKTKIDIAKAGSSSIDDHLYGQVKQVRAEDGALILEIEHPSDCITLDRIESISNGKNVCSILPIMKKVKDTCPRRPQIYDYRFEIPQGCLEAEKVLFHVRSLEGKAFNFLLKR